VPKSIASRRQTIDNAVVASPDLIFASRAYEILEERGYAVRRVDSAGALEPDEPVSLVVVDWGRRESVSGMALRDWLDGHPAPPRVLLFGPHRDLDGAATARSLRLGPVLANSQLVPTLRRLPRQPLPAPQRLAPDRAQR